MEVAVMISGAVAEIAAWQVVVRARRSLWVTAPVFVVMGGAALLVRRPELGREPAVAALWGFATGLVLYGAARGFVSAARRWEGFARDIGATFALARGTAVPLVLGLALVGVLGEELFWRGLVQAGLSESFDRWTGALLTWGAYVVVGVASGSRAVIAAAIVGGALWAWLFAWTGGVLASIVCHGTWTLLMVARPPAEGRVP